MTVKKMLFVGLLLFALAGCGGIGSGRTVSLWVKDGVTPKQERLDYAACMFEANKHSQEGIIGDPGERIKMLRDLCLEAKGYRLVSREFIPNSNPFAPQQKGSIAYHVDNATAPAAKPWRDPDQGR